MREITLSSGKTIKIRPLTFGEFNDLREKHLDLNEEILEFAELQGFSKDDVRGWPMPDALKFQKSVAAETFGAEEETKN